MKKVMIVLLTVALTASLFVGCGKKEDKLNSLDSVKKSGKLLIGLEDSYPPMEFRNSKNDLVGFDIELGNEIAKKLGVKAEYVTTDFNGIILALNASKFDTILSGMSITDKRKEAIDFSTPYVTGGQIIAVKSGDTSINSIDDLKDKIVGCQLGSIGDTTASATKGLKEVKKYDKIAEALQELSSGRVNAVIMDAQVGGYYTTQKSGEYKILNKLVSEEPMGMGFKKGDNELKDATDKAILELKNDGTLTKLSIKWFGFDAYKK
jgi:polar amino acid transport system substrate-binding protein